MVVLASLLLFLVYIFYYSHYRLCFENISFVKCVIRRSGKRNLYKINVSKFSVNLRQKPPNYVVTTKWDYEKEKKKMITHSKLVLNSICGQPVSRSVFQRHLISKMFQC